MYIYMYVCIYICIYIVYIIVYVCFATCKGFICHFLGILTRLLSMYRYGISMYNLW